VVAAVRPEHLQFVGPSEPGLDATVELVLPLGPSVVYDVLLRDGAPIKITTGRATGTRRPDPGERVRVGLVPEAPIAVFEA
jgi:putative spermidine/putrescine transport system ATP-binding protein